MDFLSPTHLVICGHNNRIWMKWDERKAQLGAPRRALPLSNPDQFIILYNVDGEELGVIKDLQDLEPHSRALLELALSEAYRVTKITRVLEVDRDPISGRIRWRVEVDREESEPAGTPKTSPSPERRFRLVKGGASETIASSQGRQLEFYLSGAEDVHTARYPRIFLVDTQGNRYEVEDCEALDMESRRQAERYF